MTAGGGSGADPNKSTPPGSATAGGFSNFANTTQAQAQAQQTSGVLGSFGVLTQLCGLIDQTIVKCFQTDADFLVRCRHVISFKERAADTNASAAMLKLHLFHDLGDDTSANSTTTFTDAHSPMR